MQLGIQPNVIPRVVRSKQSTVLPQLESVQLEAVHISTEQHSSSSSITLDQPTVLEILPAAVDSEACPSSLQLSSRPPINMLPLAINHDIAPTADNNQRPVEQKTKPKKKPRIFKLLPPADNVCHT